MKTPLSTLNGGGGEVQQIVVFFACKWAASLSTSAKRLKKFLWLCGQPSTSAKGFLISKLNSKLWCKHNSNYGVSLTAIAVFDRKCFCKPTSIHLVEVGEI